MAVSNIGLAGILSDPFGKTAKGIMNHVLTSEVFDGAAIEKLIQKSAKKKTELILESVKGCNITSDQRFKMKAAAKHMDFLDKAIFATEAELYARMKPHISVKATLTSHSSTRISRKGAGIRKQS